MAIIVDVAAVTALGQTLSESWRKLSAGESAIRRIARFDTVEYHSNVGAAIDHQHHDRHRSRLFSLIGLLLDQLGPVPTDAKVLTATTKAGIDNLERSQRGEHVHLGDIRLAAVAEMVTEKLHLSEVGGNVSAACASSTMAISLGASWIRAGRTDVVLVVCADLLTEFVFSGFSALGALSPSACRPFDHDRCGLSLGEGAAALLLMSRKRVMREQRTMLGEVTGWGAANDATHITAPDRHGTGLANAIKKALLAAGLAAEEIGAVSAHGTGTVYNDAMELNALQQIFGARPIPIHSVKGALGHTLGAAGGIEAAIGLCSLQKQMLPPTVGLVNPDGRALGWVDNNPATFTGDNLLAVNSGFGGINAAIILKRGQG
jgi:3-oxoacyl-[acyl-carrier-protein] synthase II